MKNTFMVIIRKMDANGKPKFYAKAAKIAHDSELLYQLRDRTIMSACVKDSRRAAEKEAQDWNDFYKDRGTYYFDKEYWATGYGQG